jgi:hypothetical protein
LAVFACGAGVAFGQEFSELPARLALEGTSEGRIEEEPGIDAEIAKAELPREIILEEFSAERPGLSPVGGFVLGPMAGYLRARGSDHGAWFGGVMARLYILPALAAEASVSLHQDRFEGGAVRVTQWPVQVTGLLFPFQALPVDPYVLGGAGWYYTRVHTRGSFASFADETDRSFGAHVGAGLELRPIGAPFTLFGDVRYIWIRPTTDAVERADFSFWQVTLGLGLNF